MRPGVAIAGLFNFKCAGSDEGAWSIEDGRSLVPEAVAGPQLREVWSSRDLLVGDTGRTKLSSDIYLLPGFCCSIRMILDLVKEVEVKVFNGRHVITTDSHLGSPPQPHGYPVADVLGITSRKAGVVIPD